LRNKVIELDPLHFQVAGGSADSRIRLNGAVEPLQVVLHTQFKGLQLNRLFPAIEQSRNSAGRFYGIADLRAKGDSVQAMMDVVDGNVQLAMGPGQVSNILLEAVGLDAGEMLRLFATGDRMIKVRCVVANFGLRQGMAEARALVAATQDTNVIGTGSVDLAKERLDLTFHPEPKDMSILAARAPIHLSGSFKDPKVRPDAKVLAAKGIGAVLLGLVNPVLALVPLIETGPGKDSSCGELIVKAQEWSRQSASSKQARARGRDPRSNSSGQAPRAEDVLREDKAGRSAKGKPAQSERDGASADREDAPRAEELLREQDG
jgi:uncharacterized protein involved in outer membrane biogenesis